MPTSTNFALGSLFDGKIVTGTSPVQIMKAVKNPTELIGMREASVSGCGIGDSGREQRRILDRMRGRFWK